MVMSPHSLEGLESFLLQKVSNEVEIFIPFAFFNAQLSFLFLEERCNRNKNTSIRYFTQIQTMVLLYGEQTAGEIVVNCG